MQEVKKTRFFRNRIASLIFEPPLVILKLVPNYFINIVQKNTSREWMWTVRHSLSQSWHYHCIFASITGPWK